MDYALITALQESVTKKDLPELRVGMEIIVFQKIKEGDKSRTQKFEGMIINMSGKSPLEKTITVRHVFQAVGIEKTFPIHSPTVEKIEVVGTFKVRHKNIRFIRKKTGNAAKFKEIKEVKAKTTKVVKKSTRKGA